jgi:hypothetical protein
MAGTASAHAHWHRPAVSWTALRLGWPRRVAAALMVLVGGALVAVTFFANLYNVGPAFDRMTDGFRPIMTQQSIQAARQDTAGLAVAGTEMPSKMLPALAQQLNMTPAQLNGMLTQQYPDVAAGIRALPQVTPSLNNLINTLDEQRGNFALADAIPTKSLPATTVPWALLAVGIVAIGLGIVVWFTPKAGAITATVLGAALIAVPLSLNMVSKAAAADSLNSGLKPVYNEQLVVGAQQSLQTLSAMGTQLQEKMLPALATQLHMQPAQLTALLQQQFPATAAALNGMPAAFAHFDKMITQFDKHLADYNVVKPVEFTPIAWLMISGGIALFVLGGAGLLVTARSGPARERRVRRGSRGHHR